MTAIPPEMRAAAEAAGIVLGTAQSVAEYDARLALIKSSLDEQLAHLPSALVTDQQRSEMRATFIRLAVGRAREIMMEQRV